MTPVPALVPPYSSKVPQLFCRVTLVLDLVLHAPALAQRDGKKQVLSAQWLHHDPETRKKAQGTGHHTHEHDMVVDLLMLLILTLIPKPNTEPEPWSRLAAGLALSRGLTKRVAVGLSRGFLPPSSSPLSLLHASSTIEPLSRPIVLLLFPFLLGSSIELCLAHSTPRKSHLFWDMTRSLVCSSFFHCVARFACPRTPIIAVVDAAIVAPRLPLR